MMRVAVVAHAGKSVGGGLVELRRVLERHGIADPLWYEVPKSRKAPERVKRALDEGAELVIAWGGDGTVQRCIDVLAGGGVPLAIVPAGTANLLATNLGIPADIEDAVETALHGARRTIDVGRLNGERFGVMAGAGLDAAMIRRRGRGAQGPRRAHRLRLDGRPQHHGGAVRRQDPRRRQHVVRRQDQLHPGRQRREAVRRRRGVRRRPRRRRDARAGRGDGGEPARVGADDRAHRRRHHRPVALRPGHPARTIDVKLGRKVLYELDGGDREKVKKLEIEVEPGAIEVCVPVAS